MPVSGMLQVTCTRSDGATVVATLNYNPTDGAILSGQVVNSASVDVPMLITNSANVTTQVSAPPGTTNYTAAQIAVAGFTNLSQIHGFTVTCV
jgi:hypothetical protein